MYFCIVFYLFCLFTYFHFFFPVFTCKYILTLKKAKAESALSLIYSCTVNGLIPLYYRVIALISVNIVPSWDIEGRELASVRRYPNEGQYSLISVQ